MAVWRDRRRADLGDLALMSRRPPPWTVEQTDACFIVKDHTGHSLAYVYFEEEPGRRVAAHLLTRDDARRIAAQLSRNAHSTPKPSNIPVRVLLPSSEKLLDCVRTPLTTLVVLPDSENLNPPQTTPALP
jgi:hypothetical protein